MYKVVIPEDITDAGKDYLRERGYELIIGSGSLDTESIKELIKPADGIIVRNASYSKEVIQAAPNLKVISRHGVGLDQIDTDYCNEKGIYVTYTPEANALAVAEHTIGFIFALAHEFKQCDDAVREGNWGFRSEVETYNISGKVLGLVGYGRIAKEVAKIATKGLAMKVIVYRSSRRTDDLMEGIEIVDTIDEVFEKADFVSLHTPAKKDTMGIVNMNLMKKMKRPSYFINTSRGGVVVESDLYEALKEEIITGAALDVYEKEPPNIDNPLFGLDNVILTPHCATHTKETKDLMGLHAAIGLHSVLDHRDPKWLANKPNI